MTREASNRLLRVKEAAMVIGISFSAMRSLDKRQILPAIRDWAGHRRYREDDVYEFREKLLRGEVKQPTQWEVG